MKTLFRIPLPLPAARPARLTLPAVALLACTLLTTPIAALAQGSICAEGGGSLSSDSWAAPAFEWMLRQARPLATADGGPVRVVILGSVDDERDLPTDEHLGQDEDATADRFKAMDSTVVRRLYINSTNANDEDVAKTIREAHIVWMRGGSQTRYCNMWKGTPVEAGIRAVFARGGVIGGTSAGCAVLGEVIYDAAGGSCEPSVALRDPFAQQISFTTGFLELTPGVLFDSHFTERARIARLAVFLARVRTELGRDVLGIGMDTRTALCIGPDGTAEVFGTGAACFMHLTPRSRLTIQPAQGNWPTPPLVTDIAVRQIVAGEKINIRQMTASLMSPKDIEHSAEWKLDPTPYRKETDRTDALFIRGDATQHAERAQFFISPELPSASLFHGTFALATGAGQIPGAVASTRVFSIKDRTQNAAGGVLLALATTNARWGTFMDMGAALRLLDDGTVQSYFPHGKLGAAMSAPVFIKSDRFTPGPAAPTARQTCSFDGLTMHVLPALWSFDPASAAAIAPSPTASPPPAPTPGE